MILSQGECHAQLVLHVNRLPEMLETMSTSEEIAAPSSKKAKCGAAYVETEAVKNAGLRFEGVIGNAPLFLTALSAVQAMSEDASATMRFREGGLVVTQSRHDTLSSSAMEIARVEMLLQRTAWKIYRTTYDVTIGQPYAVRIPLQMITALMGESEMDYTSCVRLWCDEQESVMHFAIDGWRCSIPMSKQLHQPCDADLTKSEHTPIRRYIVGSRIRCHGFTRMLRIAQCVESAKQCALGLVQMNGDWFMQMETLPKMEVATSVHNSGADGRNLERSGSVSVHCVVSDVDTIKEDDVLRAQFILHCDELQKMKCCLQMCESVRVSLSTELPVRFWYSWEEYGDILFFWPCQTFEDDTEQGREQESVAVPESKQCSEEEDILKEESET